MNFERYRKKDGIFFNQDTSDFSYSDGAAFEHALLKHITDAQDISLFSPELAKVICDWASTCHLSPVRANLLRPISHLLQGKTLELGAGCGIISRYLGELGGEVTALEASAIRAKITRARTRDLDNVSVVCDRIEDFISPQKFDAVTMIGVLQYSRLFSKYQKNAEVKILEAVIKHLDEQGVLIISIQNKLGLKYFAGCPEANTGVPFFGIENRYHDHSIIRFDYNEVKSLLTSLGLPYQTIYFPFPDYHLPVSILSEQVMKKQPDFSAIDLIMASAHRDMQANWSRPHFMLESAWENIFNSGIAANFSNAFLIVASRTEQPLSSLGQQNTLAWHYSADRPAGYAIQKEFKRNKQGKIIVHPSKLTDKIIKNNLVSHVLEDEEYVFGRTHWAKFVRIVDKTQWALQDMAKWLEKWVRFICQESGISDFKKIDIHTQMVSGRLFDCTPFNSIEDQNGNLHFIDREWVIKDDIKLTFVLIRGLISVFTGISYLNYPNFQGTMIELILALFKEIGINITEETIQESIIDNSFYQLVIHKGYQEKHLDSTHPLLQLDHLLSLENYIAKSYPGADLPIHKLDAILSRFTIMKAQLRQTQAQFEDLQSYLHQAKVQFEESHIQLILYEEKLDNYLVNPLIKPIARKIKKAIKKVKNKIK